jgi:hypothetical protein
MRAHQVLLLVAAAIYMQINPSVGAGEEFGECNPPNFDDCPDRASCSVSSGTTAGTCSCDGDLHPVAFLNAPNPTTNGVMCAGNYI